MSARGQKLALFAGGGSGGHVFPGLAVARELESRGWDVAWVGNPEGMEARLLAERGVRFLPLAARPLVGKGLAAKVRGALVLAASTWRARTLVRELAPRVAIGTGGYASAAAVLGARLAGVPTLLLEPNAEAGAANRLLSRWSAEALVAHDATAPGLRCPATTTGVPVRQEFFEVAAGLPMGEPLRLLVLGGSQGARSLNEVLPAALTSLRLGETRIFVRHQTGARHVADTRRLWRDAGVEPRRDDHWHPDLSGVQVAVVPFLDDVAGAMAESHLVISRAGAITLAEICAAGRPSLLVPLALAGAHQEHNARRLADAGAAVVLTQASGDPQSGDPEAFATALSSALGTLLADRKRLDAMAASSRALGRRDAAARIADRIEARALPVRRTNGGTNDGAVAAPEPNGGTA